MRSNYLSTALASRHDVDLLALVQESLLTPYFGSVDKGLAEAYESLSTYFSTVEFPRLNTPSSKWTKYSLALKSLFKSTPYSAACYMSTEMQHSLNNKLASKRYDIIHFDTIGLTLYRSYAEDSVCTLDHHNIESHMMLRRAKKETNPLKKFYFWQEGIKLHRFEKKNLEQFDAHITCSDLDTERLLRICPTISVKAIPNPVRLPPAPDDNTRSTVGKNAKPSLLFIGGLDWYPNTDAVLHFCNDILPEVQRRWPSVKLNIIGKNPPRSLSDLAMDNPAIRIHGFVDSIEDFYEHADMYICPIRDGGGTKLKVLDAMAHSAVVVGYREAFEGLNVQDGAHCIICEDEKDFCRSIDQYLQGTIAASQIRENARSLVEEQYSTEVVGEQLNRYYMEVANGHFAGRIIN
jgi:glycosyltransferase involved in cell wall biosynthesis